MSGWRRSSCCSFILRAFYKYKPGSSWTNPLLKHQWCPNLKMLSLGLLSTNAQAEESQMIRIFSSKMENTDLDATHNCIPDQFSSSVLVCSFVEALKSSLLPLWIPAPLVSLQHYPGRLVNTGNTNPQNTSLLCLEDCHDNSELLERFSVCEVDSYWDMPKSCPSDQVLPFWQRACSCSL